MARTEELLPVAAPRAGYLAHREAIDHAIREVLESNQYILGTKVEGFERAFAAYTGMRHGIGVNTGTDAIHLALRALGIGPGDEVITVAHGAVATVAAIRMAGAEPVLADVDPDTLNISTEAAKALLSGRTKAIVAVHLYGHPAELAALAALCAERGLHLIEDCAQAHGATFQGRRVGSLGMVSTFSFYPTKNLGGIGDGGMVLTNDPDLARRLRLFRQYGWETPQHSLLEGWNSRLDPLQAAILEVKLGHLDRDNDRRRELAAAYSAAFHGLPLRLPVERNGCRPVYHLYVVRTRDRETRRVLQDALLADGILTGIHYPEPVHEQPAYRQWIKTGPMPVTQEAAGTVLSLPLFPELTDAEQQRVIHAVRSFFAIAHERQ